MAQGFCPMIHYSCDLCKRKLDPSEGLHYVVKLEVIAAADPQEDTGIDEDRDYLREMHEMLERTGEDGATPFGDQAHQQLRFDLCPTCCKKYLKNPLGREVQFEFSKN
jgi:hypothetical protein